MVQKTKIIPNKRSTLVAFTVGERYQPGGEFKVLKFNNSHCMQITLQGDRGSHRLSGFESETSFCQDSQRLHPGNVRDLRSFIRKVFRLQSNAMVGDFGTPGLTETSPWQAVSSSTTRCHYTMSLSCEKQQLYLHRRGVSSEGLFTCQELYLEFPTSASTCKVLKSEASLLQTRRRTCSPSWPWFRSP